MQSGFEGRFDEEPPRNQKKKIITDVQEWGSKHKKTVTCQAMLMVCDGEVVGHYHEHGDDAEGLEVGGAGRFLCEGVGCCFSNREIHFKL